MRGGDGLRGAHGLGTAHGLRKARARPGRRGGGVHAWRARASGRTGVH
jgi:hypothetical protein